MGGGTAWVAGRPVTAGKAGGGGDRRCGALFLTRAPTPRLERRRQGTPICNGTDTHQAYVSRDHVQSRRSSCQSRMQTGVGLLVALWCSCPPENRSHRGVESRREQPGRRYPFSGRSISANNPHHMLGTVAAHSETACSALALMRHFTLLLGGRPVSLLLTAVANQRGRWYAVCGAWLQPWDLVTTWTPLDCLS